MSAKWDIDLNSPYAHMPDFQHLRPAVQDTVRETIREQIIKKMYEQHEAILRDAIPKALGAKLGLAFKSELIIDQPHPLFMKAVGNVVTHKVRFFLTDTPPSPRSDGWMFLPYASLKDLWDAHGTHPVEDFPKVG